MSTTTANNKSRKWLTRTIASLLVPSYIFAVCGRVHAGEPTAAEVIKFHNTGGGTWDQLQYGLQNHVNSQPPAIGNRLQNLEQFVWVPGNNQAWAHFRYVSGNNSHLGVQAGPHTNHGSSYHFPCRFEVGTAVIGWTEGRDGRACAHQGAKITLNSSSTGAIVPQSPTQASKTLETAQAVVVASPQYHYCTVAAKDRGWWVDWGTPDNPCEKAQQSCLETGSADGCEVIGSGDWSAKEQDVLITVGCANEKLYTAKGTGREVATQLLSNVVQEAKVDTSKVCILNVYQPDDLVVVPASENATLVLAQSSNNVMTVDALAGDVIVQSAQKPEGILLREGSRYIHPQGTVQSINISEVVQTNPVQIFLNPENWAPEDSAELNEYRTAVGQSNGVASNPVDPPRRHHRNFFNNVILPLLGVLAGAGLIAATDQPNNEPAHQPTPRENPLPETSSSEPTREVPRPRIDIRSSSPKVGQSIDFSSTSEPITIFVYNVGSAPLDIASIRITNGAFAVSGEACSNATVLPGDSCNIEIQFQPDNGEVQSGLLIISSNAENGEQRVGLHGTPPPPAVIR